MLHVFIYHFAFILLINISTTTTILINTSLIFNQVRKIFQLAYFPKLIQIAITAPHIPGATCAPCTASACGTMVPPTRKRKEIAGSKQSPFRVAVTKFGVYTGKCSLTIHFGDICFQHDFAMQLTNTERMY